MKTSLKLAAMMLAALSLAACASNGPRLSSAERLEMYRAHAGEPVSSFRLMGSLNSWTALGDTALAVWTRSNEAFLLELHASCHNLDFANAISLSSSGSRVHARFDRVTAMNASGQVPHMSGQLRGMPCLISEIRPLNVGDLRDAERNLRQQVEIEDRPAESGDGGN